MVVYACNPIAEGRWRREDWWSLLTKQPHQISSSSFSERACLKKCPVISDWGSHLVWLSGMHMHMPVHTCAHTHAQNYNHRLPSFLGLASSVQCFKYSSGLFHILVGAVVWIWSVPPTVWGHCRLSLVLLELMDILDVTNKAGPEFSNCIRNYHKRNGLKPHLLL